MNYFEPNKMHKLKRKQTQRAKTNQGVRTPEIHCIGKQKYSDQWRVQQFVHGREIIHPFFAPLFLPCPSLPRGGPLYPARGRCLGLGRAVSSPCGPWHSQVAKRFQCILSFKKSLPVATICQTHCYSYYIDAHTTSK